MDSLDAEIVAWISKSLIAKGGAGSGAQLGHAFNGNQYASGSGGGGAGKREQAAAGSPPTPPNEFSGNQYPKPNWGDKNLTRNALKDVKAQEGETKTAAQVMEAVTRYADAHPDTMNGYSDKESHIKFIAEHEDAIPKWLVDKVTQKDVSVLEDNNYHTANTVIASQRPDLKGWTNEKALAQWDTQKSASEIRKGDLPGHEFHGNQHTGAQGIADRAKAGEGNPIVHNNLSLAHKAMDANHAEKARWTRLSAADAARNGLQTKAVLLGKLADLHQEAANAHGMARDDHFRASRVATGQETPYHPNGMTRAAIATKWSQKAADATKAVEDATREADEALRGRSATARPASDASRYFVPLGPSALSSAPAVSSTSISK